MNTISGQKKLIASIVGIAAAGLAGYAIAQAVVPPGPNKVQFPTGWDKGVLYGNIDRADVKQYREYYASAATMKVASAGQPIPDGTVITMAIYSVKPDQSGSPAKDAGGRFVKDRLTAVFAMQKQGGFGADIPEALRNGDWKYQAFTPDGAVNEKANLTACYTCHLPFAKQDFVTSMGKLSGK